MYMDYKISSEREQMEKVRRGNVKFVLITDRCVGRF